MADWTWLAGVAAAVPATVHTLWMRRRVNQATVTLHQRLADQIAGQAAHAMQLWPPARPGQRLTQVEEIAEAGKTWLGRPLDPDVQRQVMADDAARLLGSYQPPPAGDGDSAGE